MEEKLKISTFHSSFMDIFYEPTGSSTEERHTVAVGGNTCVLEICTLITVYILF